MTISSDLTCKIWEIRDDKLISFHVIALKYEPVSITWSPIVGESCTPLLFAIGSSFGTVNVWRLPGENRVLQRLPELVFCAQGHSYNAVTSLSIDSTGLLLASACSKGPTGVVNIWSLCDGTLVHTTTGGGGVHFNGMHWLKEDNSLSIAFSRSKSVSILKYDIQDFKKNLPLAGVRRTLLKKNIRDFKQAQLFKLLIKLLPSILLNQHHTEKLAVQTGVHLMHSVYFKSLTSLAVLLELDKYVCYMLHPPNHNTEQQVIPDFHWLHTFSIASKIAEGLIKRTDLSDDVISLGLLLDADMTLSSIQNTCWTLKQDEQIIQWVTQIPHDWQIGGKCTAYLWGSDRHGQLAELGYSASVPSHVKSFSTASKILCGQNCTFVIEANGTVLACGEGSYGRLGQGNSDDLHALSIISSLQGFVISDLATSVGSDGHSLALAESGEVFSWGDGDYGKL